MSSKEYLAEKAKALLASVPRRAYRKITRLTSAHLVNAGPALSGAANSKPKGARAKGLRFEKEFGKRLRQWAESKGLEVRLGQWIHFIDANGRGFAQPDAYVVGEVVWLFECKLTQSDQAESQMRDLYAPLLERIYGKKVVCCQVYKNQRYPTRMDVKGFKEFLQKPEGSWNLFFPIMQELGE